MLGLTRERREHAEEQDDAGCHGTAGLDDGGGGAAHERLGALVSSGC